MGGDVASGSSDSYYDVFLSFGGLGTPSVFVDLLYQCLVDAGISVFRDEEELRKGEEIGRQIWRELEKLRSCAPGSASIVVDFDRESLIEEHRSSEDFGQEILRAIDSAKIWIPIFSRNYASSNWCLRELAAMVAREAKSGGGKTIIPIFYDVTPADVRLETPLYRDALWVHMNRYMPEEVSAWEDALKLVASLPGCETGSSR